MKNKQDWELVVDHMHYNGKNRNKLSSNQHAEVYVLADGFGDIGDNIFDLVGYDWSHVRDSSDFAIKRMANKIRKIIKK